jgi:hypothetical protein
MPRRRTDLVLQKLYCGEGLFRTSFIHFLLLFLLSIFYLSHLTFSLYQSLVCLFFNLFSLLLNFSFLFFHYTSSLYFNSTVPDYYYYHLIIFCYIVITSFLLVVQEFWLFTLSVLITMSSFSFFRLETVSVEYFCEAKERLLVIRYFPQSLVYLV